MKQLFKCITICTVIGLVLTSIHATHAGSATWNLSPASGNWNTATNWTPTTVPNSPSDIATFASSGNTNPSLSADIEVNSITFNPGASAFTISVLATETLTVSGAGIVNNSGVPQNFVAEEDEFHGDGSFIYFTNNAVAGTGTFFTLSGGHEEDFGTGGRMTFFDSSSADHATIDVLGTDDEAFKAAVLSFYDNSTAGNSTITLHPGTGYAATLYFSGESTAGDAIINNDGGFVTIQNTATAGNSTITLTPHYHGTPNVDFKGTSADRALITANGGQSRNETGYGLVVFDGGDAATSTIINNGGIAANTSGGLTNFVGMLASASSAILIANGGTNGGAGGSIRFTDGSNGGTARVELSGNASLDLTEQTAPGVTIGSLEGSGGHVHLGTNNLTVGSNNLSTEFHGAIQDEGSLTKIGTGNLTLSNASTYTGGTIVNGGTLLANASTGSGTGKGPVQVMAGTFGGGGNVTGPVTIGIGQGTGAILAPGTIGVIPGTFVVGKSLQMMADATLKILMDSGNQTTDTVVAKGIRIRNAQILFGDRSTSVLPPGTVFTLINNTAPTPITGTFSNLADGGTITIGSNTFQANYEGGDGNDLTLTVVP